MLKECRFSFVGPNAEIWCQVKEYRFVRTLIMITIQQFIVLFRLLEYKDQKMDDTEVCDPLHSSLFKVLTTICYQPFTGDLKLKTTDAEGFRMVEKNFNRVDEIRRDTGHVR